MTTLEYKDFINEITKKLKERLGEDAKVTFHETVKNNSVTYDAINIFKGPNSISPNLPLKDFYREYREGVELEAIVEEMVSIFKKTENQYIDINRFVDFSRAKENIMIKLIGYEKNKERLEKLPHIRFLDFAVTYYFYYRDFDHTDRNGSIQIENSHLDMWKINKETLHELAMENSKEKLPVTFRRVSEILSDMLTAKGLETTEFIDDVRYMEDAVDMYVLTNEQTYFGAAVICYSDILKELGQRFQSDYLVLPSSIHELIVLPVTGKENFEEINQMIRDINLGQVAGEEVLSDHSYYYDFNDEKLRIPSASL